MTERTNRVIRSTREKELKFQVHRGETTKFLRAEKNNSNFNHNDSNTHRCTDNAVLRGWFHCIERRGTGTLHRVVGKQFGQEWVSGVRTFALRFIECFIERLNLFDLPEYTSVKTRSNCCQHHVQHGCHNRPSTATQNISAMHIWTSQMCSCLIFRCKEKRACVQLNVLLGAVVKVPSLAEKQGSVHARSQHVRVALSTELREFHSGSSTNDYWPILLLLRT